MVSPGRWRWAGKGKEEGKRGKGEGGRKEEAIWIMIDYVPGQCLKCVDQHELFVCLSWAFKKYREHCGVLFCIFVEQRSTNFSLNNSASMKGIHKK